MRSTELLIPKNKIGIFFFKLFLLLVVFSCVSSKDKINFESLSKASSESFFRIRGENEHNNYTIEMHLWLDNDFRKINGYLFLSNNSYYIKLDRLNMNYVEFLKFNLPVGSNYKTVLNDSYSVDIEVAGRIPYEEKKNVTTFRLKNYFFYQGHPYDVVYLASIKKGVLGSYISRYENGVEYIGLQRGELLESLIDYSNKEFIMLK